MNVRRHPRALRLGSSWCHLRLTVAYSNVPASAEGLRLTKRKQRCSIVHSKELRRTYLARRRQNGLTLELLGHEQITGANENFIHIFAYHDCVSLNENRVLLHSSTCMHAVINANETTATINKRVPRLRTQALAAAANALALNIFEHTCMVLTCGTQAAGYNTCGKDGFILLLQDKMC